MFGRTPREPSAQDAVDLAHLRERVDRLEAAVADLQGRLQAAPAAAAAGLASEQAPAYLDEVRTLKAQGKLIHAIKLYREQTGVGLREAKDAVERLV